MKLIDWCKGLHRRLVMTQAIRRVKKELVFAIKANNFTLAAQIRDKLDDMPCPMCGKDGGFRL
jgi:protein-arginine kinase activator protein McsA